MLNELQSKGDLAGFLGLSLEKLDLFVYPTSMYDLYRNRLVPKRNGGYRELLIPRSDLKRAQRLIASELEKGYKPLPCVHGFVKGRSIKTNAENHIGSQVIVGLDIKDFFPSISSRRVCGLLVSKKLGLTPEVAFCISRIVATPKGLPQGAPSSPIISNMICLGMDKQLMHLSREYRYQYSRYADDLTFSFNSSYFFYRNFYSGGKLRLPNKLRNAITNFHGIESFELNEDKSFYSCSFSRQLVTGVVCNQKTNIKREQYRRLRSTLHRLSNGDIEGAMGCYYGKTIAKLTDAERGSFEASLRGSLDFYKSLIKDPWTSGPLMRLGSLYNKTKPEDTPVFPVALQQDIDHILGDEENLTRIPASLMGEGNSLLLRRAFEGAVVEAARRAAANYTLAVPQFYGGRIQLLLPLCLTGDKPELALTIQREDGFYAARTCLTLDMAYNNARLICRPETSWIKR